MNKKLLMMITLFQATMFARIAERYSVCEKIHTIEQKVDFFKFLNLIYFNKLVIDCPDFNQSLYKTARYQSMKIPVITNAGKYEQAIRDYQLADVYIKWVNDRIGYGLFAATDIARGTLIGVYTGALTFKPYNIRSSADLEYAWAYPMLHSNGVSFVINAQWVGNELRFINRSVSANCRMIYILFQEIFMLCCIAQYDIACDEEITIPC